MRVVWEMDTRRLGSRSSTAFTRLVFPAPEGAAMTNSLEFLNEMDFPGTKKYVESVAKQYHRYQKEFQPKNRA